MSKAQQAAEERPTREDIEAMWTPALVRKYPEKAFEVMTRLAALPEVPDPAVIKAMARAIGGVMESGEPVPDAETAFAAEARAAYAALRGAMQ